MNKNNSSKASIREVYKIVQPMSENITILKANLENFIIEYKEDREYYLKKFDNIKEENKNTQTKLTWLEKKKISITAFIVSIGVIASVTTIIVVLLKIFKIL